MKPIAKISIFLEKDMKGEEYIIIKHSVFDKDVYKTELKRILKVIVKKHE